MTLCAQTQYDGITHTRTLHFDGGRILSIEDAFEGLAPTDEARVNFSLPPDVRIEIDGSRCFVTGAGGETAFTAVGGGSWEKADYVYSPAYNHRRDAARIVTASRKNEIRF